MEKVNITLEAMPQNMTRLEEKVDALTEIVTKLSAGMAQPAAPPTEDFIGTEEACEILHLSTPRIRHHPMT